MSLDRDRAVAYVEGYGKTWETWDVEGLVALHNEDVVYVAHPEERVVGREALRSYFQRQQAEQGTVSVRMGTPVIDGDHVAAEFWVTATKGDEEAAFTGCFIARLEEASGQCTHFREYWFDLEGHLDAFQGWGE
jgi:ketosteroid isomerase-like protein